MASAFYRRHAARTHPQRPAAAARILWNKTSGQAAVYATITDATSRPPELLGPG
jgi:hypothetical protein